MSGCYNSVLTHCTGKDIIKPVALFLLLATVIHAIALYNDYWWASPAHHHSSRSGKIIRVSVKKTPATIKPAPALPDISPAASKPHTDKRAETDASTITTPSGKPSLNQQPAPQKSVKPVAQNPVPPEPSGNTEAITKTMTDTGVSPSEPTENAEPGTTANSTNSNAHLFEQWLASLQYAINRQKNYPYQARRRNVSGEVEVELKVSADGSLLDARIVRGKKVFHQSTLKAVHSAFPMPPTPKSHPVTVHLTVHYNLR